MNLKYFILQHLFYLNENLERLFSYTQGKGYGASTITREIKYVYQALGRTPQLAIDIGGNVGDYTAELRKRTSSLEIYNFEPSTINHKKLVTRFSEDSRIKIIPCGVANENCSSLLFSDFAGSGLGSLSRRKLDHFGISFNHSEPINIIRFEDYWKTELNRRSIDIVKIDIEGHEFSALLGFGEAITSVKVVQFEFGGTNIDTRTFFQDFWYFFSERNFQIFRISPFGLVHIKRYKESYESFLTANYIAINQIAL